MKRSLLLFEAGIKSPYTKKNYRVWLDQFLKFSQVTEHDDLITFKDLELQAMLEDYLFHLKETISTNSIPPKFASLELFFAMNDKILKTYPFNLIIWIKSNYKCMMLEDLHFL